MDPPPARRVQRRQVSSVADVGVFHSWSCPPQRPGRPWSRPSSPAQPTRLPPPSPRFRYYSAVPGSRTGLIPCRPQTPWCDRLRRSVRHGVAPSTTARYCAVPRRSLGLRGFPCCVPGIPPPWPARPCPHGSSVGACHAAGRASRVASIPLFHACYRHYPGGTGRCSRRSLPDRWQPSPLFRRVGFRVTRFEACSAFTRVVVAVGNRVTPVPPRRSVRAR